MLKRRSAGRRPQLTFTADFHELVQGDLLPGPCVLRYDPWRIVPRAEIMDLPGSQRPVRAHIRCDPAENPLEHDMFIRPGMAIESTPDPCGQSTMLKTEFPLPETCDEIECWFSYVDATGSRHWDSDGGANFHLRFPTHDLHIRRAQSSITPDAHRLEVKVSAIQRVQTIDLRWRVTQPAAESLRQSAPLAAETREDERTLWSTPKDGIVLPTGATVVFDLMYTVDGRKFVDNNEGTWYLPEL